MSGESESGEKRGEGTGDCWRVDWGCVMDQVSRALSWSRVAKRKPRVQSIATQRMRRFVTNNLTPAHHVVYYAISETGMSPRDRD